MAYRARNIMIAVALAAVAALLTSFYVTSYKRHVQRGNDHVTVLVAKQDIEPGTTGEEATKLLVSEEIPRAAREKVAGAITKPDQLTGLVATGKTLQGQIVTTRSFGTPSPPRCPRSLDDVLASRSLSDAKYALTDGPSSTFGPAIGRKTPTSCSAMSLAV